MKTAYILHGTLDADEYLEMDVPSPSNAHWLPWLQQKFLRNGTLCQCLEMPTPHQPSYAAWGATWQQAQLTPESIVVAHSAGCGFILKWLTENPQVKLAKLVLVAPWLDDKRTEGDFLAFTFTPALQYQATEWHVLYADNDPTDGIREATDHILHTIPQATLHRFPTYGHFCLGNLGTPAFPELWAIAQ